MLVFQNSNSFFQAAKSVVSITQVLDASCSVNYESCAAVMANYGSKIKRSEHCGQDFQRENPLVQQAYNGFVAYPAMYAATCLRSASGSYCLADAITNAQSPTDSYIYYVGVGLTLPGGSRPTCNECLQNTFRVYSSASSNASAPVSQHYVETAQRINLGCGPNYVTTSIPAAKGAASWTGGSSSTTLMAIAMALTIGIVAL
jgi:hypothetical protein